MVIGPFLVMAISYIASHFQRYADTNVHLVPGYVGLYATVPFLIVFSWKFNQPYSPTLEFSNSDLNARNDRSFNTQIDRNKSEDSNSNEE